MKNWYYLGEETMLSNPAFYGIIYLLVILYACFAIANGFYFVLYTGNWACVEKFKGSDEPWPWQSSKDWSSERNKMIKLTFINIFVLQPLGFVSLFGLDTKTLLFRGDELPSFGMYLIHMAWMFVMEDFAFYWSHRLLHHPRLYP